MKDIAEAISTALDKKAKSKSITEPDSSYDVDLIPIPISPDKTTRTKFIEKVLAEWDEDVWNANEDENTLGYLVKVRKLTQLGSPKHASTPSDAVYKKSGELNLPYLVKNSEVLFKAGEYALCRNVLKAVLSSGQRSVYAHFWIGRCHEAEGQLELARLAYEQSIAYSASLEAYERLAGVYLAQKRFIERAETLERALLLKDLNEGKRMELMLAAADGWKESQRLDRALRVFEKALTMNPNAIEPKLGLAWTYMRLAKIPDAKRRFEEVLAQDPKHAQANAGLGQIAFVLGQKREAHDWYARSLESDLSNTEIILQLVKCAYDLKSYPTAARLLGQHADLYPVTSNLLYSLAGLQYHLERKDQARSTIERILQLEPHHAGAIELKKMLQEVNIG